MKKNFVYAMMSAIALSGAVSFSACSSSDELTDVNPTYDGESVKTQFTISLPQNLQSPTRMGYATVQEAQTIASFRGMSGIVIIPYSNATARTTRLGSNIALGANTLIAPSAANDANAIPNGKLLANSNAVLYNDVTIPVGTAGFLFYGKATGTDGFADGALTPANLETGESADISFTPVPIMATPVTTKGEAIAAYVTQIAGATNWAGCANPDNSGQSWYNAGLGALYTNFTSMKAGASAYVQAAVQDLYKSIKGNTDAVSTAIKTAITTTYASDDGSGTLTFVNSIDDYPSDASNNFMPDGCATLTWSGSTATASTNSAIDITTPTGTPATSSAQPMNKIVYPAALYYFVDSDIKTSNTKRAADYDGTNDWDAILAKYGNGTAVSSSTNSVAITKPIQYAVGRLDVTVNKLNAAKYYDRKGDEVTIPAGGFQLTGVLIGGQKPVDYKFEQNTTGTEYAIYDKTINTQNSSSETGVSAYLTASVDAGPNYTLALETATEQDVYVVLEFLNSGDDFQGFDGVVKKGCKFYMVALLVPDADVTTGNTVSGTANTEKKVFKQDFKTIANFTIGAGAGDGNGDGASDNPQGFANAYVTIPDLRTPQLELGFSVDLTWREGITFNYTF